MHGAIFKQYLNNPIFLTCECGYYCFIGLIETFIQLNVQNFALHLQSKQYVLTHYIIKAKQYICFNVGSVKIVHPMYQEFNSV